MKIFVLGGVKSGKSMFAQCGAKALHETAEGALKYIATMHPGDAEDELRIRRHIHDRRGWGFETIEEERDAARVFPLIGAQDTILLDSVTSYVQNNVFGAGAVSAVSAGALSNDLKALLCRPKHAVAVSDYIFSDAETFGKGTLYYMKLLGEVHRAVADASDVVIECASSGIKIWKNAPAYDFSEISDAFRKYGAHLYYKDI